MGLCFLLFLALVEWKLGYIRFLLMLLFQATERYSAPRINVPLPQREFPKNPDPKPLHPRAGPEGFIQCYDKGTNSRIGTVRAIPPEEVREIVRQARIAQETWALTPFSTRRKLMFALLDYVLKHQKEICETACVECGKTLVDGALGEMLTTLEKLRWTAEQGEEVLKEEVRDVGLMTIYKRASLAYEPFGVMGAIVSWNYPFHNIIGPMISALFAGNAFVGKVSEYSSYYASYYESIVRDGLRQLGYNPNLVSFITGFADTGAELLRTVDKLTFIGSPQVGKIIMRNASETLTPVVLELGGKDPAIILDDADMQQVLPIVMRGTFQNCGQNCVGLERIVIHESLHDKLVDEVMKKVSVLTQGASSESLCDLGAMTMGQAAIPKIQQLVKDTENAGAKVLCGGEAVNSSFFPPTVIINVTPDMPIAQEEVFGPVLVVMKFKTDDEAVQMVNACPYGLGSSVFSRDIERAKKVAKRLRTGMYNINDFGINYLCQSLPFGGVKISGFDRFAGREGLRGNCVLRASTTDRIPGVKTVIPPILQYPISKDSFEFMMNLSYVIYGRLPDMITSAFKLMRFKQPKA
eukprot:gene6022-4325_t